MDPTTVTSGASLTRYLLLAKNATEPAASSIIADAARDSNVFVFGELLDMPSIQKLQDHTEARYTASYRLLELFAYGTYPQYKAQKSQYPELDAKQLVKLKKLTLVTIASEKKTIPYATLMSALDLGNVRELEDLIIESIYDGLLKGRLDQKLSRFEVIQAAGRDISRNEVPILKEQLVKWCAQSNELMVALQKISEDAIRNREENIQREKNLEEAMAKAKTSVKALEGDSLDEEPGLLHKRTKKARHRDRHGMGGGLLKQRG